MRAASLLHANSSPKGTRGVWQPSVRIVVTKRRRTRRSWVLGSVVALGVALLLLCACCGLCYPSYSSNFVRGRIVQEEDLLPREDKLDNRHHHHHHHHHHHERGINHSLPLEFANDFDWSDVDFGVQSSCGVDKCYWPSVSDASYGYLVTTEGNYDSLRIAFDFGARMEETCGARQLQAHNEPAVLVNVTTHFMKYLGSLVHNPSRRAVGEASPWVYYEDDTCVTVQKVAAAPKPHLLYGTYGTKWPAMVKSVPAFQEQLQVPLDVLRRNLQAEKRRVKCILRLNRNYYQDLQGLIDTKGHFHHIDLDAHVWRPRKSPEKERAGHRKSLKLFTKMIDILTLESSEDDYETSDN